MTNCVCVCVTRSYLRGMDSLAAWMSPSAMPATQNEGPCRQVPRLPRKTPTRAAAPPGGSVYCTFPTKARLPHESQPRPSDAHARSSSSTMLCVLHLSHESQPRASGCHARSSSSRRLSVLACHTTGGRGPAAAMRRRRTELQTLQGHARPPGGSVYCACHTKASRSPPTAMRAAAPPGGSVYCTAPATRQAAAGQRRPRPQQLLQEALCTAPATRQPWASRGPAAATRTAAPAEGSVYCACRAKASCVMMSCAVTSGVMSCAAQLCAQCSCVMMSCAVMGEL